MTGYVQVTTTAGDRETAQRIATELVDRRLAACVQVLGPMQSTYRWRGAIEQAEEWLCVAKCRADRFDAVEAAVTELHPYETPELIATPIIETSAGYGRWLHDETRDGEPPERGA